MIYRILHAAQMRQPAIGVIKQMEYEQKAADAIGLQWKTCLYAPKGTAGSIVVECKSTTGQRKFKSEYFKWLRQKVRCFDVLLLRYKPYDYQQLKFIRTCPIPVITMHHSLEIHELHGLGNLRSHVLAELERFIGSRALKYVHAIAGVTWQIANYQRERSGDKMKPVIHYSNGAWYDDHLVLSNRVLTDRPEFLFISSKYPVWMGLDLLIEAAKNSKQHFLVHIVGSLTDAQKRDLEDDERFKVHGILSSDQIETLMKRCAVGLSTFGAHRKKFTEGNTLKVREYLRGGVPVYAGHKENFPKSFPYFTYGKPDFDEILAYAKSVSHADRNMVSELSKPMIDKRVVLQNVYDSIVLTMTSMDKGNETLE